MSDINEYEIKVGDIVRLQTGGYADPHTHGRVVQVDTIRTLQGIPTVNVYVRWFSVDGKPDDHPSCFAPCELFKCPLTNTPAR